ELVMLRALGLGDFLTAVPAYRAIAREFPEHYRVLAAPIELAPLARLCGDIDEVVDTHELEALDASFHETDVAINLHGRGPQSHSLLLATHPKQMIAFRNEEIAQSASAPQWRKDEHEVTRWCRLLQESGIAADPRDLHLTTPRPCTLHAGAVVLHPSAASEARRWPVEKWIELASRLHATNVRLVITGTPHEFRRCRLIARAAHLPIEYVLAGHTTIEELASIVSVARAVICGDTGVAHLATAFRTPSVLLFGPTSPAAWGPPQHRSYHRVLWRGMQGDPHGDRVHPGLAAIEVDEVFNELISLLETPKAG
ncbi:MAG: glycosyltransferase family 9 protein, partial [Burkholderiales bacterium]